MRGAKGRRPRRWRLGWAASTSHRPRSTALASTTWSGGATGIGGRWCSGAWHSWRWDGRDARGRRIGPGVVFARERGAAGPGVRVALVP